MVSMITATPIITHSAINHFTIGAEMSLQAKATYVTERQANDVQGGTRIMCHVTSDTPLQLGLLQ
jgi:hypothetical protein